MRDSAINILSESEIQPLMTDAKGLAHLLCIGISCLYAMDRSGELGPVGIRFRRRRVWPIEEVKAWVKAGCPRRELWTEIYSK